MRPAEIFRFCPRCGHPRPDANVGHTPLQCSGCGFTFFFNPTVAGAAFIFRPDGHILLIRREKDPAAGKFGVPGGFLDFGESAEEGTRREVREEVGLELQNLRFVTSFPNLYPYREVLYPVVDLYFAAEAIDPDRAAALDAVRSIEWRRLGDVPDEEMAFDSLRVALRALRAANPDLR
ncbi:NUDIX domain-containing protein [Gemmata sp. JC717]|uniref:NUDIX hydrolase n=1 Tax=Gemmata algarum TaxID=2975278 RepID=UPI0021BAC072|nr:NUDIX domain-containing protein [Gemmata algarum]MDY3553596.1 NUDIX domain-containing protein [Gemmata algarum]